ncbi:MAG: glycine--tRNA ligase subunit beta [Candidatus Kaelpia aquatica]|nr:glycine--tRNA ligase subunit beta [Candidatus Kaelpia aquatica]
MSPKSDFLIELGVEELPSNLIESISEQFKDNFIKALDEARVVNKNIQAAATSRRLVLFGELGRESLSQEVTVQGPSERIAYDKDNKPSKALCGFVKSQGVSISDAFIESTDRGNYLFIKKKESAKKTERIIEDILLDVISAISVPRYMKWDSSEFKFTRPIRSILIIFGATIVRADFKGIKSSDFTLLREGAEFKKIKVRSRDSYLKELKERGIILSPLERGQRIKKILDQEAKRAGLLLYPPGELLTEVANLVESPTVIRCSFNKSYLGLPEVVLLASMAKYQRVFALVDKDSKLANQFLAILDLSPKNTSSIRGHYEFVLDTRLKDAVLFYNEDIESSLDSRIEKLEGIALHNKLGTLLDKTKRLKLMTLEISKILNFDNKKRDDLIRSVELFKADLLTKMVYEFPSLEGVMGGIYAKHQKESKGVAAAISEHYKPRSNDDTLPNTELGALLSLVDKLYNVVGFLGIGIVPSGSMDPFTIRRQIQSIVRILIQYQLEISLENLFSLTFMLFENSLSEDYDRVKNIFLSIGRERFSVLMADIGVASDLVEAVSSVNFKVPSEVYLRLKQLTNIYDKGDFYKALKVAERTERIVKDKRELKSLRLKEGLLKEREEKELYEVYLESKDEILKRVDKREYDKATILYGKSFYGIIDRFFSEVLVNVDDQELRENRKLLLFEVNKLLTERVLNPKEMEVLKDAKSA